MSLKIFQSRMYFNNILKKPKKEKYILFITLLIVSAII